MSTLLGLALLVFPRLSVAYPSFQWNVQEARPILSHPHPAHIAPLTVRRSHASYYVEAKAGTPGQVVKLQLRNDAGTTILVPSRNASCDALCNCTRSACESIVFLYAGGLHILTDSDLSVVNPSLSSTFHQPDGRIPWRPNGITGSNGTECICRDRIGLEGLTIANVSVTLASGCNTDSGFLSLGHAAAGEPSNTDFLTALVNQGLIATEAFSLWLSGWRGHTDSGSLLFGALDKNKYSGSLKIVDLVHSELSSQRPIILLSHVRASSQTGDKTLMSYDDIPYPVALNLGVDFSTFPQHIAEAIWEEAGAEYLGRRGCPAVPCALIETDNTFTYGFDGADGPQIKMHLWTMIVTQKTHDLHLNNTDGEALCIFSVLNSTNSTSYALGQDFLRNAYVVFDIHNEKIALAQGRSDSGALNISDVVPFEEYGASIPSAQLVPRLPKPVPAKQSTNTLTSTTANSYSAPLQPGVVIGTDSIMKRDDGGDPDARGKDDAFDLSGDLGTWLSIVLVTLVGLAVAYTVNYQRKNGKPRAGIKPLHDGSSTPDPTVQESDIELGSAPTATSTRESQTQARPQETRVASQGDQIMYTSAHMSPVLPLLVVNRKDEEEEPKSPTSPPEAKLKSQMPEEKVLGTWSDLRKTYL